MATRENNTMAEFCSKMMKTIAEAKMEPDADDAFLGALEGDILAYLKPPVPDTGTGGAPGGMGAMGSAMGQVMQPPANGPGMPNPDEMRRMLAQ